MAARAAFPNVMLVNGKLGKWKRGGRKRVGRRRAYYYRNLAGRFCKKRTKGCFKWSRERAVRKKALALRRAAKK